MVKPPILDLRKNAKMIEIPALVLYGKMTHIGPMQEWQNEQYLRSGQIWQNNPYLSYAKMAKWAKFHTRSEYGKITHIGPMENERNKKNSRLGW